MKLLRLIPFLLLALVACQPKSKYPYTIEDYSSKLQPHLIHLLNKGIVGMDDAELFIEKHASDAELKKLTLSEHPVLRGIALRILVQKDSMLQKELLETHLDDTAVVSTYHGEWGVYLSMVSDDMLDRCFWSTDEEKQKTVDKVVTQHNYLSSAYNILPRLPVEEKYYSIIRQMAQRDREFRDIEYALYALARYKRSQDTALIRQKLDSNYFRMERLSFRLMEENPNDNYWGVLHRYYRYRLVDDICEGGHYGKPEYFFKAIAAYQQPRSADILLQAWNKIAKIRCTVDTSILHGHIAEAVWQYQSPAYTQLTELVQPTVHKMRINTIVHYDTAAINQANMVTKNLPIRIPWYIPVY